MWEKLTQSRAGWDAVALRLGLGVMIIPHGAQKLLGWFGGYGFEGTMAYFTDTLGIPWLFALCAVLAEFFGGLALIAGFFTRFAALGVGFTLVVAASHHLSNGFFMNWAGSQTGEGIEFFLLTTAMAVALVVRGAGSFGIDQWISKLGGQHEPN